VGFTVHGVERVVAGTMAVNIASRRVMEKAGLRLVRTFHQPWPYPDRRRRARRRRVRPGPRRVATTVTRSWGP